MKLLYYRIESKDILTMVQDRAAQYARTMALLRAFKRNFRVKEVYGYHFHAFRQLRIEGVVFDPDAPIPRGWYQRAGDPPGVHRPSSSSRAGKRMMALLQKFNLPEPTYIYRACGCSPFRHNGRTYYPSIGAEGDTFLLAVPVTDDAAHREIDGLVPVSNDEVKKMSRKARKAAKSRFRRMARRARALFGHKGHHS